MSVLSLHPGLQLGVPVEKKRPIGAGEEGLDQWAALRAHMIHEALSGKQTHLFILHIRISSFPGVAHVAKSG